jgi:uncharacterized protein (DUF1330 family)
MNLMNTEWRPVPAGVDPSDPAAVAEWRQEVDDTLLRMVGRALRRGTATTSLERSALAAARVLAWQYPEQAEDRDWLIRQAAGVVSREVLAGAPAPFGGQSQFDTVCA